MHLEGIPTDDLPKVLATGHSDIDYAFISLSGREPDGRDAEYIEWHSLDHRPEQYRLQGLRNALRLVSTPSCRAQRAASTENFDAVDHVMTYMFHGAESIGPFNVLGDELNQGGRMPLRLPSVGYFTSTLAGKLAAPRAVAGADVIPFRPATGVYMLIEEGQADPRALLEVEGVAGIWWFHGNQAPAPYDVDTSGRQVTYCFLDRDPLELAPRLGELAKARWATGEVSGLLAAPFYAVVPFEWERYLP